MICDDDDDTGEIDFSKWRKLDSRNFGISSSRIPASPWIVLKVLQSEGDTKLFHMMLSSLSGFLSYIHRIAGLQNYQFT